MSGLLNLTQWNTRCEAVPMVSGPPHSRPKTTGAQSASYHHQVVNRPLTIS